MKDGKWNKNSNLGHFIGRATLCLRYDEENCNLQCAHCNAWRDKESMLEAYRAALELKYGAGTVKRLKERAQETISLSASYLEEVIHDSKVQLEFLLNHT